MNSSYKTTTTQDFVKPTSSKNGYEIRADMLVLAKDILQFEYTSKMEKIKLLAERDPSNNQIIEGNIEWPATPTVQDILTTATKLYDFVNKR